MPKQVNIIGITVFFILVLFALGFGEESITITTYYPSPYGVYKTLRLNPSPRAATCQPGEMTYHDGSGSILAGYYFCDNSAAWQSAGGGGGFWSRDATYATLSPTTSSDKVGIGGSWLLARLSAFTSDGANTGVFGGNWFTIGTGNGVYGQATGSATGVRGESGSGMGGYFSSSGGYALITGAGNVGIGTTNPGSKLHVSGGFIQVDGGNGITASAGGTLNVNGGTSGGALAFNTNGANVMNINSSGNVGIGGPATTYKLQLYTDSAAKPTSNIWTIASDKRIKKNISDFTDGLNIVMKLKPHTYQYNGLGGKGYDDTDTHIGFVAQEVEPIAPYMIETSKRTIGGVQISDFKNYQGHALSFILVNAIQEQQDIIKAQQLEIDGLKARLDKLEEKQTQTGK